jgi:hypothetical protein
MGPMRTKNINGKFIKKKKIGKTDGQRDDKYNIKTELSSPCNHPPFLFPPFLFFPPSFFSLLPFLLTLFPFSQLREKEKKNK